MFISDLDIDYEAIHWQSEYQTRRERLKQMCAKEEFRPTFTVQDGLLIKLIRWSSSLHLM